MAIAQRSGAPASQTATVDAPQLRLLGAASGPSGKSVGERFEFHEERKRFIVPQDKSVIIYMEWEGPAGEQRITGIWKKPDGSTGFLSSDIELVSPSTRFNAYWTFYLNPGMDGGIWQFEAMVNGVPAGSYPFEIVSPPSEPQADATLASPKPPTMDDLYGLRRSLVWIYRMDDTGHRDGSMSGFVLRNGVVATSFQAVDNADHIEVEFADGRKVRVEEVLAYSAQEDWALIVADTAEVPALPVATDSAAAVGHRLVVFNAEPQQTRVIGGVDFNGRKPSGALQRFVFGPGLPDEAMGGPLLDVYGNVVGLLSGCVAPGTRLGGASRLMAGVGAKLCSRNTAVPIAALNGGLGGTPVTYASLRDSGEITAPVRKVDTFLHGGTRRKSETDRQRRIMGRLALDDQVEFNQGDGEVTVYSWWQVPNHVKRASPILLTGQVYDSDNQLRAKVEPKTLRVGKGTPLESQFSFPLGSLKSGIYRIDTLANGVCVWRTFIEVRD
ncbi:MAG: trypsin-like peptidase domain-containing protein [Bryobacterales bacterium]|nr:trypsin-like peptidase domain-containing protein [Bryobacterales bacterium]